MLSKTLFALAAATAVTAQRPADTPICDFYTTALLKENTAENQLTLLTLLVNTVVIGNYTEPNVGVMVPGILAPGKFEGTDVELIGYFDGSMATTNEGGDKGVKVNFLDGGGAAPLMENKPAEDDTSKQYFLLTHLYQFFGGLLGCTEYGNGVFKAYGGETSMYEVHKFMDLGPAEMGYFITQVALAGASFGVAAEDLKAVGESLNAAFGLRCAPPSEVIPGLGEELNTMCVNEACPLHPNATCAAYEAEGMGGGMDGDMSGGDDTKGEGDMGSDSGSGSDGSSSDDANTSSSSIAVANTFLVAVGIFVSIFVL